MLAPASAPPNMAMNLRAMPNMMMKKKKNVRQTQDALFEEDECESSDCDDEEEEKSDLPSTYQHPKIQFREVGKTFEYKETQYYNQSSPAGNRP